MFEMADGNTVMLGLGEPDFQPPEHVVEAYKKALESGKNKYGPTRGIPELREAIARRLHRWKKDVDAENILVTVSATEGLFSACQSLFEEGDEVLVPDPGFVLYDSHVFLSGAKPVRYPLLYENGFLPDQDTLLGLLSPKTKGIIVNTPSNPTGTVFNAEIVKMISDIANDHGLFVVSDEVYDEIIYDAEHISFLGRVENHVYVNSFSKTYAMTGWRMGYIYAEKELLDQVAKIHYYTVACPPTPTQYAALAALRGPQDPVRRMVEEFKKRRDYIVSALQEMEEFETYHPQGAFYVFPRINLPDGGRDIKSEDVAMHLLRHGVLSTPGRAFGERGEGHIRFSYANSLNNIKEGVARIKKAMSLLK